MKIQKALFAVVVAMFTHSTGFSMLPPAIGTHDHEAETISIYKLLSSDKKKYPKKISVTGYMNVEGRKIILCPSYETLEMWDEGSTIFVHPNLKVLHCTDADLQEFSGCYVTLEGLPEIELGRNLLIETTITLKDVTWIQYRGKPQRSGNESMRQP